MSDAPTPNDEQRERDRQDERPPIGTTESHTDAPASDEAAIDKDRTTATRVDETLAPSGVDHPPMPAVDEPRNLREDPDLTGYAGEPILTGGDGGAHVLELARLLAELGYHTPISRVIAGPILTNDVYVAVEMFRRDNDVRDELVRAGDVVVGPATWAAIKRAAGA